MSALQIDFYTRPGCHLCDEALQVLKNLQQELDFEIRIVNISESAHLMKLYGNDIPVATLKGRKILKHRADEDLLRRILCRHV
ncbi:glutaredoxin family protein [Acidobacteria bacterium AH-259-A15]|nr:glutaredoxin family protein [Acidobacteria bacterium AH-259-A15]